MTATDIAQELYDDLADTSLSVPVIITWLKNKVGEVNLLLHTEFEINSSTYQIYPEPSDEEKSVFYHLYKIYYYGKRINTGLGAQAFDSVLEISDDGTTTRFLNKNEVAKTYKTMLDDERKALSKLVQGYKIQESVPQSVDGNDVLADSVASNKYNRSNWNV